MKSIAELMKALAQVHQASKAEPFIRAIRFPNLKNLSSDLRISFEHPITAIVGPNGTNKTTILRALEGSPLGYDLGDHWFETALDQVETEAARYIYSYQLPTGRSVEVIKTRVSRSSRRPDYFETRAPRASDGMTKMPDIEDPKEASYRSKTRWRPVEKEVLYLDFRHAIPAFDIHFLLNHAGRDNSIERKKALVRRRSSHLKRAVSEGSASYNFYGRNRVIEAPVSLTGAQLEVVARILGRDYDEITLIGHDLFDVDGRTALIRAQSLRYSEAFAGSGEFAAVVLVHELDKAPERALVLLDEPETSLHPRAQEELLRHVADVSLRKKLQVVISTHSPTLVEKLRPESIKVLDIGADGKVQLLAQRSSAREAFNRLGVNSDRLTIAVEDVLAREIVLRAARALRPDAERVLDVRHFPGGASTILNSVIPALADMGRPVLALLDGDQNPGQLRPPAEIADVEISDALEALGITNPPRDSGPVGRHARDRDLYAWCYENLRFLPGGAPEQLLLSMLGEPVPDTAAEAKLDWVARARFELGLLESDAPPSGEILGTQRRALARVPSSNSQLAEIVEVVKRSLEAAT